jgi:tRNA dimethylallyltransferase
MSGLVVALVGSTATGKTEVAERVASELQGEVVCADSRQVFRELDAGTGKPSAAERASHPHHLFDRLSITAYAPGADAQAGERATAGWYARSAAQACAAIHARGRIPVLVGGSGLYLRAALIGLSPTPAIDPAVRAALREDLERDGAAALHARLAALDPASARTIRATDPQRIVRALEVIRGTGRTPGWWRGQPGAAAVAGVWRGFQLTVRPEELRARVRARTRAMFDHGLIEETRALISGGLAAALVALGAIGYDEALALEAGRMSRPEAEERTSLRTLQLAKRQRTWFRHQMEAQVVAWEGRGAREIADRVVREIRAAG